MSDPVLDPLPISECDMLRAQLATLNDQRNQLNFLIAVQVQSVTAADLGNVPVPLNAATATLRLAMLYATFPVNVLATTEYMAYLLLLTALGGITLQIVSLEAQMATKGC